MKETPNRARMVDELNDNKAPAWILFTLEVKGKLSEFTFGLTVMFVGLVLETDRYVPDALRLVALKS